MTTIDCPKFTQPNCSEDDALPTYSHRQADPTKILTRRELGHVLADLRRKVPRSKNTRLNLVVFRLAACCGLRASEIARLQTGDVHIQMPRPHLRIRASAAKGGKPRMVPLWWDAGTLEDLIAWRTDRLSRGAIPNSPFVCSWQPEREKIEFSRHTLRNGSVRHAVCLDLSGSRHSRSTMAGTLLLATPWLVAARWRKSVTPWGTLISASRAGICTWRWKMTGWGVCLGVSD